MYVANRPRYIMYIGTFNVERWETGAIHMRTRVGGGFKPMRIAMTLLGSGRGLRGGGVPGGGAALRLPRHAG
jgi:hypothetical protein